MRTFPQILQNIPVKERRPIASMAGVSAAIREAEQELGARGRVLVRYSGTELLARVMVEAETEQTVKRLAAKIIHAFQQEQYL